MSATRYSDRLTWTATRKAAGILKAAREASGKRQVDVAAGLGWSTAKVGHAENAVTRMTPEEALRFAALVGADLGELTGGEP